MSLGSKSAWVSASNGDRPNSQVSIILAGAVAFCFLILEPLRAEILVTLRGVGVPEWFGYLIIRTGLQCGFVVLLVTGLRGRDTAPMISVPQSNPEGDPLLTLRFFACLLVLLGHGLAITFVPTDMAQRLQDGSPFWLLMGSPWFGVWVFFSLSGYLIGKGFYSGRYAMDRGGLKGFYWNRFWRIAPVYVVALLIVSALIRPTLFRTENFVHIAGQLVFWQQNDTPGTVISALWSVQTEVGFYLLSPLLFMGITHLVRRGARPTVLLAIALFMGVLYRWMLMSGTGNAFWVSKVYVTVLGNLDVFVAGMLMNWLLPQIRKALGGIPTLFMGLFLIGASYLIYVLLFTRSSYGSEMEQVWLGVVYAGPTITALLTIVTIACLEAWNSSKAVAGPIAGSLVRWTQLAGLMTYSIYVWHESIFIAQMANLPLVVSEWDSVGRMLVAVALTTAIAGASYFLVERRFERFRLQTKSPFLPTPGALG